MHRRIQMAMAVVFLFIALVVLLWMSRIRVTYTNEIMLVDPPVHSPICQALWSGESESELLKIINTDPELLLQRSRPVSLVPDEEMERIMNSGGSIIFPSVGPIELLPLEYAIRLEMCDAISILLSIDDVYSSEYLIDMVMFAIDSISPECAPPFLNAVPADNKDEYIRKIKQIFDEYGIET